jgi:UMF1 family MFS transporter
MPDAWPPVTRREIVGWAMFDFANSAYTTIVVTVAYSIYFTKLVAPGASADFLWGIGVWASNAIVLLGSPVVGAMADDSGRKKLLLAATWLACVGGTAALWFAVPGAVVLGLALFALSNVAYSFGENLCAAFLPELATPATMGRVSGFGWGLGYLGGLGSLLLVLPLVKPGFTLENLGNLRLAWVGTALFFLLGALPTFLLVRERASRGPWRGLAAYARHGFTRLAVTARSLAHFRELARFLAVFFVYSCGLTAVIAFAAVYAERTVGFSGAEVVALFLALQLSAALGAALLGFVQDRLGARRAISIALWIWILVSAGAYLATSKGVFWAVAMAAGLGIGSLQASSRALVGLLAPRGKTAEIFGFWGLASRAGYMVGPLVFGAVSSATGSQRLAIAVNAVFFVVGLLAMRSVDEARGRAAALAWEAREDAPPPPHS